ncbi:nuclear transport factor 2 family protein [Hymenobacter sp. BT730]|uniref:nuclear transport factor 2 family protein n=1 Tax=Hymenobacter sp. BT730 TaxID=3063332 RepID=UPI0026DF05D8|nr:nuclear transport factor 2 family protein [Hymenobacter sp. BT730]
MKPTSFLETEQSHLALAQYYRWFQIYERPYTENRIKNATALLADDALIKSVIGDLNGPAEFQERLMEYKDWQNAHHVQYATITPLSDDKLSLLGHALFQNIRPDGTRHSFTIQYDAQLTQVSGDLPVFTFFKLTPTSTVEPAEFADAYPQNRVTSFMHYWLYCMETHKGDATKMRELFTPDFELNMATGGHINNWEQFEAWIKSTYSRIRYTSHRTRNLTVQPNPDGTLSASFMMDWQGISADGEPMIAEMQHEWLLEDNLDNRFAALKKVQVVATKPFQVSYSF